MSRNIQVSEPSPEMQICASLWLGRKSSYSIGFLCEANKSFQGVVSILFVIKEPEGQFWNPRQSIQGQIITVMGIDFWNQGKTISSTRQGNRTGNGIGEMNVASVSIPDQFHLQAQNFR